MAEQRIWVVLSADDHLPTVIGAYDSRDAADRAAATAPHTVVFVVPTTLDT